MNRECLYSLTNTARYFKFNSWIKIKIPNISSKIYSLLLPTAMKFERTTTNKKRKLDSLTDKPNFRYQKIPGYRLTPLMRPVQL